MEQRPLPMLPFAHSVADLIMRSFFRSHRSLALHQSLRPLARSLTPKFMSWERVALTSACSEPKCITSTLPCKLSLMTCAPFRRYHATSRLYSITHSKKRICSHRHHKTPFLPYLHSLLFSFLSLCYFSKCMAGILKTPPGRLHNGSNDYEINA